MSQVCGHVYVRNIFDMSTRQSNGVELHNPHSVGATNKKEEVVHMHEYLAPISCKFGKKRASPVTHLCGIKTYQKYLHKNIMSQILNDNLTHVMKKIKK